MKKIGMLEKEWVASTYALIDAGAPTSKVNAERAKMKANKVEPIVTVPTDAQLDAKKTRLKVLENSLKNKEEKFGKAIENHFLDVRSANGQPLNDKRNDASTLKRWESQDNSLRRQNEGIDKTKQAIDREKDKIENVESFKKPSHIESAVKSGELTQWRKYPNTFFVNGVEKARIIVDEKTGEVSHKYVRDINDKDQHKKFAQVFNRIKAESQQTEQFEAAKEAAKEPTELVK